MEMIPRSVRAVRFGPFEVDLRAGELRKQDRRIRLPDQPLHILTVLLEHPGEMVTREELRQRLWPADTFVDFDHGLNSAINRLREALGDSVEKPTYIETIPRRGYRFIAAVEDSSPAPLQESLKQAPAGLNALTDPASPTAREDIPGPATAAWRRRARSVGVVASVLALALAAVVIAGGGWEQVLRRASAVYRSQRTPSPNQSVNREALEYYLRAQPYFGLAKRDDNEAAIRLLESAVTLVYRGRYEESLTAMRSAQRFNPSVWAFQTSFALFQLGRRQEAREKVEEFLRKDPDDRGGLLAGLQALFAAAEENSRGAEQWIQQALRKEEGYTEFHHTQYIVAAAYARMNKPRLALQYLRQAADNGFPCYTFFEKDTNLDTLRGDPRFRDFMTQQKKQWNHFKATM